MNRAARRRTAAQGRHVRTGYLHRLVALHRVLGVRPGLHHVVIEHDADCEIYRGAGCNCVPDISVHRGDDVIVIDINGHCTTRATS